MTVFIAAACARDNVMPPAVETAPATTTTSEAPPPPSPPPPPAAEAAEVCVSAPGNLCPVDNADRDPTFVAYREQLQAAVAARDTATLLSLIDPNVRTDFGGGGGLDDFRKQWALDSPDSPLWRALDDILRLGGSFRGAGDETSFWAPYVYAVWPESADAFEHVAAVRANVALREKPDPNAAVVAEVDWAVLRLVGGAPSDQWRQVRTADGKEGFVAAADVRSPIGYRAGFNRVNGQWKMTALVAGD